MGGSVVQCQTCQEWNWAGSKKCSSCGSNDLTISLHELHYQLFTSERRKKMDLIIGAILGLFVGIWASNAKARKWVADKVFKSKKVKEEKKQEDGWGKDWK